LEIDHSSPTAQAVVAAKHEFRFANQPKRLLPLCKNTGLAGNKSKSMVWHGKRDTHPLGYLLSQCRQPNKAQDYANVIVMRRRH
jgi:hypothetical protein